MPTPDPRSVARRRRLAPIGGAAGVVAVASFVLVWFQPQTLLFDTVVDLGLLSGNLGDQDYDTVAIWCRRFGVGFGAADPSEI